MRLPIDAKALEVKSKCEYKLDRQSFGGGSLPT